MNGNEDELINQVKAAGTAARKAVAREIFARLPHQPGDDFFPTLFTNVGKENLKNVALEAFKQLPDEEKNAVAKETVSQLPKPQQDELARDIRGLPAPEAHTRNWLWVIVVCAFSVVLVGSAFTIALGMFIAPAETAPAKPELVLTMFTSVVGFLAGLFVPTPGGNR
jgi:uncharacterized membrane protein YbhN (UPF0104 family)